MTELILPKIEVKQQPMAFFSGRANVEAEGYIDRERWENAKITRVDFDVNFDADIDAEKPAICHLSVAGWEDRTRNEDREHAHDLENTDGREVIRSPFSSLLLGEPKVHVQNKSLSVSCNVEIKGPFAVTQLNYLIIAFQEV